jgi:DNA repair protein RadC
VSRGGLAGTVVDSKLILKAALQLQASSLILAHNHPSGQLSPSQADKLVTQKLVSAAGSLDMIISDHLILNSSSYVSFADEGWL